MTTQETNNTDARSTAYSEGLMIGLSSSDAVRYGYRNPYDSRTKAGKDWKAGQESGVQIRCTQGAEYASNFQQTLKGTD